jgi:hypothetical protein
MPFSAALVLGGTQLVGGIMAADSARGAAQTSANAQLESARIAAEEARFRPIGTTTRFGSSQFQFGPDGRLSGAGYTVSPELQQYQDQLQALSQQQIQQGLMAPQQYAPLQGAAGGLFSLGQQYLAQSPEQVAQQYISRQQDLLAPSRERQYAQLQNQLFNTGRGGLSVGATGLRPSGAQGLGATSPEMEAYYNALAQQDLQLASQAQQAGQQQTAFGAGLFGQGANLMNQYQTGQVGALSPFQTSLGLGGTIEQMGQQGLEIGSALGGRSATAGANVGRYLLEGGMGAARTMQPANALNPFARTISNLGENREFATGISNLFGGGTGSGLSIDPYGYGIGSGGMGTVDTSMYGGASGLSIR